MLFSGKTVQDNKEHRRIYTPVSIGAALIISNDGFACFMTVFHDCRIKLFSEHIIIIIATVIINDCCHRVQSWK